MRTLLLTTLVLFSTVNIFSQSITKDVVSTAGDSYINQNLAFQMSWTLGEVVSGTFYSDAQGLYIEQGFQSGAINNGNAINKIITENHLQVFPNPFSNLLHIIVEETSLSEYQILVYNNLGQIQRTFHLNGDARTTINVQDLKPGIYYLHLQNKEKILNQIKVIKQ